MKKSVLAIFAICAAIALAASFAPKPCLAQAPTADWVAKEVDGRYIGDDARSEMEMTISDGKGRDRSRKLFVVRKTYGGQDKLYLKFTYPNDIKGTSFLVWEHAGKDSERFLYLPELGRVRRIASAEKHGNFAGTDFSYEDISGRKLEDYTYELPRADVDHNGAQCFLLLSKSKDPNVAFPEIYSLVRKDNFVVVKSEYYSPRGNHEKTYEVLALEKVQDIWTPTQLLMKDLKSGGSTLIKIAEVKYNGGIADSQFEKEQLKK